MTVREIRVSFPIIWLYEIVGKKARVSRQPPPFPPAFDAGIYPLSELKFERNVGWGVENSQYPPFD
jgi:hypothetical protein